MHIRYVFQREIERGGGGWREREERERERETDRQTDRQTYRQAGRQRHRQTETGRQRQREAETENVLCECECVYTRHVFLTDGGWGRGGEGWVGGRERVNSGRSGRNNCKRVKLQPH